MDPSEGVYDLPMGAVADPLPFPVSDPFANEMEDHRRELTGYCYRMLGAGSEAEDAVQETFLRAWRGRSGFEPKLIHVAAGMVVAAYLLWKLAGTLRRDAPNSKLRLAGASWSSEAISIRLSLAFECAAFAAAIAAGIAVLVVGSRGLVFQVVGKRLYRAFERGDAGRKRVEIAARHARLSGALCCVGRGRGAFCLRESVLRRRGSIIGAAREGGE